MQGAETHLRPVLLVPSFLKNWIGASSGKDMVCPDCHRPHHALLCATRHASLSVTCLVLEILEQQPLYSMQCVPSFVLGAVEEKKGGVFFAPRE